MIRNRPSVQAAMRNKTTKVIFPTIGRLTALSILPLSSRHTPVLLQRAVRVATAPSGYRYWGVYRWIAPNEFLAVLEISDFDQERFKVAKIRTDTGAVSFLQRNNAITKNATNWAFSPDGRWYLCCAMGDHGFVFYLCATDDSKQYKVYSKQSDGLEGLPSEPFAWLGDSQRWLNMPSYEPVEVRTLTSPSGPRRDVPSVLEPNCYIIMSSDPKHTVISRWFEDKKVAAVEVVLWNLNARGDSTRLHVPLPVPARVMEVAVSPDGDHLA